MLIRSCPPFRHPDADPALPPAGRLWWLVQSHPLQERRLAAELVEAGVPCYLPLGARSWVTPGGRRLRRTGALFPGYLFVLAAEFPRPPRRTQSRIAKASRIEDQARFHRELAALHAVFSAPGDVTLGPVIESGSRVRVASGVLAGQSGVVLRTGSRNRVYVNLHEVGMSASVEFDMAQLEPAR